MSQTAVTPEAASPPGRLATALAFGLAVYALYWVIGIVDPQIYRVSFALIALVVIFLDTQGQGLASRSISWAWIALALVAFTWPIVDFEQFILRAATPTPIDVALGVVAVLVVLEATRRTSGWVLPVIAVAFLAYGYFGPFLDRLNLSLIAHRGYSPERIVGTLYMTLEGIFGVPLDVTSTYIILFTIFGAILEHGGAGQFFVQWAMAAIGRSGKGAAAGRTVTVAGYLLGAVSGSGVANTVMLGAISWPMMRRAGYPPDTGGAILAASGLGAILAPPAMGAAAFLIAEYLQVSYFDVIAMAAIPALLYYGSVFLMVEADSRRLPLLPLDVGLPSLGAITRRGWHHFASMAVIVLLMARGLTAFRAVFWAIVTATLLSFVDRANALWPRRLAAALASGGRSVLPVAATTAAAGVIVGVVTLTGLGLKVSGLIVALAGNSLLLTVVYSALAVWVLGLAVPVTASYIIAAVMIVPALTHTGVAPAAAHMFVFYYAVLSEVSPPTALSPFAAAALTGGNPFRTTMLTWKYTTPAFVIPVAFAMGPRGTALLMDGSASDIAIMTALGALGVAGIAAGAGGWIRARATRVERVLAITGGLLVLAPGLAMAMGGAVVLLTGLAIHLIRVGRSPVQKSG